MRFLAKIAVCCFLALWVWLGWLYLDWFFDWGFKDIAFLSLAALLMLFVAVAIRKKKREPSLPPGFPFFLLRLPFILFALVLLIIVAVKLPVLFPLSTRLSGRAFHNAPLAEVLQYISEQRREAPYWRFQVYDEQAVTTPVTMTIPDDCKLREALDILCGRINCAYEWRWRRGATRPISAGFYLHRKGSKLDFTSDYFLYVQGSHAWRPPRKAQAHNDVRR